MPVFSDVIKAALEREVVGQTPAVNNVVRGVTRLMSGLTPRERTLCAYVFMGPPGTGKTYLIQTLARILHGNEERIVVADCGDFVHGDPRVTLATQLAPLFLSPRMQDGWPPAPGALLEAPPLSIIQVEFLERGHKELYKTLASALETGQVTLPDGRRGSLRNCLVFLTSGLCAGEILDDAPRIGFSGSLNGDGEGEDENDARLYKLCHDRAEEHFGSEIVGRVDGFMIFHRLQEEHLIQILDRRIDRLNRWLGGRGVQCDLQPSARDFLIAKGSRDLRFGARDLLRAHQKFVEFPVADLLVSQRIKPGESVLVDRRAGEDQLHFTVAARPASPAPAVLEIPIG